MKPFDKNVILAQELGIDAEEVERRKRFLEFGEPDVARLKELQSAQQDFEAEIAGAFFSHLLNFPQIRDLVPDTTTLERLQRTLTQYFRTLLSGNYDEQYVLQRLHIGLVHKRVGLDPKWYLGAYRKYLSHILFHLWPLFGKEPEKFLATFDALLKIVMLDIGLAIDTYHHADKLEVMQFEKRLQGLLDGIDAIVWEADLEMRFTFVSHQAQKMLGYPLARWTQEEEFWRDIILPDDREATVAAYREAAGGHGHDMEYRVRAADGRALWMHGRAGVVRDKNNQIVGMRGLMVDISALKEAEKKLIHLASYDELTGLPNRSLLQDRLRQAIVQADRNRDMVAILFIDLDRFKNINDSLGHDVGDLVLQTAAGRLIAGLRDFDTIARFGGDEFMIMLTGIARLEDITAVAQNAIASLSHPFTVGEHELFLTASIGISVYPRDGSDVQTLLKDADAAMYRAKEGGKNRFEFFTAEMNAAAVRRLQFENQLRQALARNEFLLHYQPLADLETGRVAGVEALVRWHHPELGMVPPIEFISLMEETGLIVPLGEWVLETACRQAVAWQAAGLPELCMAVNVSVRQFVEQDLPRTVARVLHETGLAPSLLKLELTESLFMQDNDEIANAIGALRNLGVRLAVDDFGTGYSSLSYLRRFPVTSVKIDQSFVRSITTDPGAAALVRSIIGMAHEMRLRVTAEGVETEGQLNFLESYRCDEVQGYLLSRPLPALECGAFIRRFEGLPLQTVDAKAMERVLLVVDDEPNITTALKRLLRVDGYRILTAGGAAEGMALLAANPVGVVLSDQRMPETSGVEFLHQVRNLYPDTVRIILSGYAEIEPVTQAINSGVIYKFLTKPWDDTLLRDNVREAFQRHELKQENARLARELEHVNGELAVLHARAEHKPAAAAGAVAISGEILEYWPVGVLGIDERGVVFAANHKAHLLLGAAPGSLPGQSAQHVLPAELQACAGEAAGRSRQLALNGSRIEVTCHVLGEGSATSGRLLLMAQVAA